MLHKGSSSADPSEVGNEMELTELESSNTFDFSPQYHRIKLLRNTSSTRRPATGLFSGDIQFEMLEYEQLSDKESHNSNSMSFHSKNTPNQHPFKVGKTHGLSLSDLKSAISKPLKSTNTSSLAKTLSMGSNAKVKNSETLETSCNTTNSTVRSPWKQENSKGQSPNLISPHKFASGDSSTVHSMNSPVSSTPVAAKAANEPLKGFPLCTTTSMKTREVVEAKTNNSSALTKETSKPVTLLQNIRDNLKATSPSLTNKQSSSSMVVTANTDTKHTPNLDHDLHHHTLTVHNNVSDQVPPSPHKPTSSSYELTKTTSITTQPTTPLQSNIVTSWVNAGTSDTKKVTTSPSTHNIVRNESLKRDKMNKLDGPTTTSKGVEAKGLAGVNLPCVSGHSTPTSSVKDASVKAQHSGSHINNKEANGTTTSVTCDGVCYDTSNSTVNSSSRALPVDTHPPQLPPTCDVEHNSKRHENTVTEVKAAVGTASNDQRRYSHSMVQRYVCNIESVETTPQHTSPIYVTEKRDLASNPKFVDNPFLKMDATGGGGSKVDPTSSQRPRQRNHKSVILRDSSFENSDSSSTCSALISKFEGKSYERLKCSSSQKSSPTNSIYLMNCNIEPKNLSFSDEKLQQISSSSSSSSDQGVRKLHKSSLEHLNTVVPSPLPTFPQGNGTSDNLEQARHNSFSTHLPPVGNSQSLSQNKQYKDGDRVNCSSSAVGEQSSLGDRCQRSKTFSSRSFSIPTPCGNYMDSNKDCADGHPWKLRQLRHVSRPPSAIAPSSRSAKDPVTPSFMTEFLSKKRTTQPNRRI